MSADNHHELYGPKVPITPKGIVIILFVAAAFYAVATIIKPF